MNKTFKRVITALGSVFAFCACSLTAFAEDAAGGTNTTGGTQAPAGSNILSLIIMTVPFLLIGYFLIIRPEKKRKKEAETLRDNLRPGNRITTIGGIVGTVETVTDDEIHLTNGLVLKRWALRSIDETAPEEGSAAVTYYEEDESSDE